MTTSVPAWDAAEEGVDATDLISQVVAAVHFSSCMLGCVGNPCTWKERTKGYATIVARCVSEIYKLCAAPRLNNVQVTIIFRQVFVHLLRELELDIDPFNSADVSRKAFIVRTVLTAVKYKFLTHPDFCGFVLTLSEPWQ